MKPTARLVLEETLPIPPSNNTYKRHYCTKQVNAKGVHIVKAYLTEATRRYIDTAGWLIKLRGVEPSDNAFRVIMHIYLGKRHIDTDNAPKVIADALTGIVWNDDSQIVEWHIFRHERHIEPRVVIRIEEVEQSE